jgi:hypothetical protein
MPRPRKPARPSRYFNSSAEGIRLVAVMYVRFPLSLRNVEDLLFERGIDICRETVRMTYLCHAASFHSNERIAPLNRGKKHLDHYRLPVGANLDITGAKLGLIAPMTSGTDPGRAQAANDRRVTAHCLRERYERDLKGSVRPNAPIVRRGGVGRLACPVPTSLPARFATSIHRPR